MATFVVTTRADIVDAGDGVLSLREAVAAAQDGQGGNGITFDPGVFRGGAGQRTVTLREGALELTQEGGPVQIDGDLNGDGRADVILSAGGRSAVMTIDGTAAKPAAVTLEGLVLRDGVNQDAAGYLGASAAGVAISDAAVTLLGCEVTANRAGASFDTSGTGGISVTSGALTISGGRVAGNDGGGQGGVGGIRAAGSTVRLEGVALDGNTGDSAFYDGGGGLRATGSSVTLVGGSASGNVGDLNGGLSVTGGTLAVSGTRLAGNSVNLGAYSSDTGRGARIAAYDAAVTLTGAAITGSTIAVASPYGAGEGGALFLNGGSATLRGTAIEGSRITAASAVGAGIASRDTDLLLVGSSVQGGFANGNYVAFGSASGGGISTVGGSLALLASTVSGNFSEASGAGAGGIEVRNALLDVRNSTLSGNRTRSDNPGGGGVLASGLAAESAIVNSTIADNLAENFSYTGIYANPARGGILTSSPITISNSIVAGNRATGYGQDVAGTIYSTGTNLFSSRVQGAYGGDLRVAAAEVWSEVLAPLADNGGATLTHALRAQSLAIGRGDAALAVKRDGSPILRDQRGEPRVDGGRIDLGAYEALSRPYGIAANDAASTSRARALLIDVLANDGRPGEPVVGFPLILQAPAQGLAMVGDDRRLVFLPDVGATGTTRLGYRVRDGEGEIGTAVVMVAVTEAGRQVILGDGEDVERGSARGELIDAGAGNDLVLAEAGADTVIGGFGEDSLHGGAGDDVLRGGFGDDRLVGGSGRDLFVLEANGGGDLIDDLTLGRDEVLIAVAALLTPGGLLDGDRIRVRDRSGDRVIEADLAGSGSFTLLARIDGAAGADLDDLLANAIA